jgi:hypothetical protein
LGVAEVVVMNAGANRRRAEASRRPRRSTERAVEVDSGEEVSDVRVDTSCRRVQIVDDELARAVS